MPAPESVKNLVERFRDNLASYQSARFNEAQLRQEFLNPFFKALGWDVYNEQDNAEAYKDVIHEDAIKIGTESKAPDYCFRIGGRRMFFLEAKKPAVNVGQDVNAAYQLRRYAWSAKLPLSILSDFDEFAVYDCRIKPNKSDKSSVARTMFLTFEDYLDKWDEIAGIFSHEAVRKGSFDKYAESTKLKRGTTEVDAAFLGEIESWRKALASNFALRNKDLSERDLKFAVQRTIDRIVFLRMCEDRGIEKYGQLAGMANGQHVYRRLCQLFDRADERYNSGLFHFQVEKDRAEPPDELTQSLALDDKPLKEILQGLYFPDSPYEFSVVPAEILGQVYEQFLGKVIRLTAGHQAKIEDKPEVKKAGGVYYTPAYIVHYIVANTVGKLVEKKTPKDVAKLRVLDPACGSGSFLVGAYQFLLDWHRHWYLKDGPEKHKKEIYQGRGGQWFLTTAEKKRILLNNIYGVDIDSQAVEVTKLSLLLKVLEHENHENFENQLRLLHERALPDLGHNIKCGNSLIGPDFYNGQQLSLLDDEDQYRINAFSWKTEFSTIFKAKNGGFDAVIGNPPYGFHMIHSNVEKTYFKAHYVSSEGSFEHYFLFYDRTLRLLRNGGVHGFIVPVTWLTIPSAASLRRLVLSNFAIWQIVWLPTLVFKDAQVNTLISIIKRAKPTITNVLISSAKDPQLNQGIRRDIDQSQFRADNDTIHIFAGAEETALLNRIDKSSMLLGAIARPCSGYNPYEVGKGKDLRGRPHTGATVTERPFHSEKRRDATWKPDAIGRDLGRYYLRWPKDRFVKYGPWLAAARDPENYVGPRLLVQEITGGTDRRIIATYCDRELYHSRDIIPVKCNQAWPSPLFLLAIVNSRLMTWRHHRRNPKARKALFPKVLVGDLKSLPIPRLDQDKEDHVRKHDSLVERAIRMIDLNKQLHKARTPEQKTRLQRQLAMTDEQIDRLVYDLYGLTVDEIRLVDEGTAE